jgi:hypothetical protein
MNGAKEARTALNHRRLLEPIGNVPRPAYYRQLDEVAMAA